MNFGIIFENFSADRWYQLSQRSGGSIDEVKFRLLIFLSYEIVKKMENLAKNAFSSAVITRQRMEVNFERSRWPFYAKWWQSGQTNAEKVLNLFSKGS